MLKKYVTILFLLLINLGIQAQNRFWVANAPANWSDNQWASSSGGVPDGGGPPALAENARFDNNGNGNCLVDGAVQITDLTINGYTGTIDINGNNFLATGDVNLYSGTISDTPGTSSLQINTTGLARFQGTTINAEVNCTAGNLLLNGSVFNNIAQFDKTGGANSYSNGGNIFNGNVQLTNSGTGGQIRLATSNPDDFNGNLILNNSGNGPLQVAFSSAGNTFDGNITIESTSGSGVFFSNGGGSSTLSAGNTISIGAGGFTTGNLLFRNFTRAGAVATTLENTGTGYIWSQDCNWGGNVHFTANNVLTRNSSYTGTATFIKTGNGNDRSDGGNTFSGDVVLNHTGSNQFMFSEINPDVYLANVTINVSGSGDVYFAYNGANTIAGNLTINCSDTSNNIYIANQTTASLSVGGNFIYTNTSIDNTSCFVANNGQITINGNLTINNNGTGNVSQFYLANTASSSALISGNTIVNSNATGTNSRIFLGNSGDVVFNGALTLNNNAPGSSSHFYLNNNNTSHNQYNHNIVVNATEATSPGVYFGSSGGSGVLAATRTIGIGGGGFIAGNLYLRNFTQTGPTLHTIALAGSSNLTLFNTEWGGNVNFTAPRINVRESVFSGSTTLTKTSSGDDLHYGGNVFSGNCIFTNEGNNSFRFGVTVNDVFGGNVILNTASSGNISLAYGSLNNTIAGNLIVNNNGNSGTSLVRFCNDSASSLTINGDVTLNNGGSSNNQINFGGAGDIIVQNNFTLNHTSTGSNGNVYISDSPFSEITFNGDVTLNNTGSATNLNIFLADNGEVNIAGDLVVNNNNSANTGQVFVSNISTSTINVTGNVTGLNQGIGTNRYIYFGNSGNFSIGGNLSLTNNSNANNSQIRVNNNTGSLGTIGGNVVLEVNHADADETSFGRSGGATTLAALRTITIGAGGFIGGNLFFQNFTQTGATAQSLAITGTGGIYSYNCNWGGSINFSAPRMIIENSNMNGTSNLTKTGAGTDRSAGGNTFASDITLNHDGSNDWDFGNGSTDVFNGDVTINITNNGSVNIAYNSSPNIISGHLMINSNLSGGSGNVSLSRLSGNSVTVNGNATINVTGDPTSTNIYLGNAGNFNLLGNLNVTQNITSGSTQFFTGNSSTSTANITGNCTINNVSSGSSSNVYISNSGVTNISGNLLVDNNSSATTSQVYLATNSGSEANITGTTNITNASTGVTSRIYLGNSGNVNCTGDLSILNSSPSNNSEVLINQNNSSSNSFLGNISLQVTHANCDGIFFGNNTGSATLAATRTITIGAGGFIAGGLTLRNFTQIGATPQSLNLTGTANLTIYDATFGGNVSFVSPRISTRGSTYAGTAILEKTGTTDDASAGGNTFQNDVVLTNSGNRYFLMGNGSPDVFNGNVTLNNTGSYNMYLAHNSLGNSIAGNLTINNSPSSGVGRMYIATVTNSNLTVSGTTQINNNGSATTSETYLGENGDITFNNNLTITNSGTSTTTQVYVARSSNSELAINGNVVLTNTGAGSTKRIYFGDQGNISITGSLTSENSASASVSEVRVANSSTSNITISGASSFGNSGSGTTSRLYLGHYGNVTFNGNFSAQNTSNATNSEVYIADRGTSTVIFNQALQLENSNAAADGIFFGSNAGFSQLASGQVIAFIGGGFVAGQLYFRNFTQFGATAQTFALPNDVVLNLFDSEFNGNLTATSGIVYLRGTTFNGSANISQTGNTNTTSFGGNTFNGNVTFNLSGSGFFRMANNQPDDYNGNVTFIQSGVGVFQPAYNTACSFAGNISFDFPSLTRFADAGGGQVIFDGAGAQSVNDLGASIEPIFESILINKSAGLLTLNTPITVSNLATFTQGVINTSETNVLTFTDNAAVAGASNSSYVDGPVVKVGNDAFTFPVGDGGNYQPIAITAPTTTLASFRAQYFFSNPSVLFDINLNDANLDHVSSREFWVLDRIASTADADVILSWNTNSGTIDNLTDLRIARWDGNEWVSEGNSSTTGDVNSGTLQSGGRISQFSPFALASSTPNNPLPVELVYFNANCDGNIIQVGFGTLTETNNLQFEIYTSQNGQDYILQDVINGSGNSSLPLNYSTQIQTKNLEKGIYLQLKQIDFDGKSTVFNQVFVEPCIDNNNQNFVFPNPTTNGRFYLRVYNTENIFYEMFGLDGKLLIPKHIYQPEGINVSEFKSGVYLLKIYNNQNVTFHKFTIK